MEQPYKGKTLQDWIETAEIQKKRTGNEYMVVNWGRGAMDMNTWPVREHIPMWARVMYRTDEIQAGDTILPTSAKSNLQGE